MELITLENGLRVALEHNSFVRSVAMNLYIDCGSRNETAFNCGSAHFLEHMMFKGTETMDLGEINRKMDKMGGQFNAYTGKEHTCVFCHVLKSDVKEALGLILEMATASKIDSGELETEKGVIIEEINMYEDSLEDLAAEALCAHIYRNDGLHYPVIGTKDSVMTVTAESLRSYRDRFYTPDRMVLSICGNFEKQDILEVVEKYLAPLKSGDRAEPQYSDISFNSGMALRVKDFEQTQILIASKGYPSGSEKRFAAAVFSAIAGGNTSSRLNMRIREELGLAYSIYSCTYSYRGAGFFMVSAGTAHKNHMTVIEETLGIMGNIRGSITPEEIERIKAQFKATTVMGNESISATASAMGKEVLYSGKYTDIDELSRRIDAVNYEQVMEVGGELWNEKRLALSVVGKPKKIDEYMKLGFN